jgi:hypothetical protein
MGASAHLEVGDRKGEGSGTTWTFSGSNDVPLLRRSRERVQMVDHRIELATERRLRWAVIGYFPAATPTIAWDSGLADGEGHLKARVDARFTRICAPGRVKIHVR